MNAGQNAPLTRRRLERALPSPVTFMVRKLVQERRIVPPPGWVRFGSLRRTTPISRVWGFDRGSPVDRYYVESFLQRFQADIRGRVLEVGDDRYTRQFGGDRVVRRDVLDVLTSNPRATIVCDLAAGETLPADAFDCVVLTQVLQFVYSTEAAVQTVYRTLKPGGVALVTVPGITQLVDEVHADRWYWSFTTNSIARLFADAFGREHIRVVGFGNVLSATGLLQGLAAEELHERELRVRDPAYDVIVAVRAVKRSAD